ncbi:SDR family NAD(P)-dependent oxidoreductase [Halomarina litorea]|uniref:SDR family NAD(P)-dependent oxidoreductase n=1 Tax=Halomarina litorea TaxID=2961595 RepID=UPI0020C2CA05|nr:SDR family oxidoreductase [Halomarina sp. BCD28]
MGTVSYDFEGDTVAVAGGASGIGRAVALAFARAGASVVVADLRERPADQHASVPTHRVVHEGGGDAAFVETDVTDVEAVDSLVEATREFGGLDVLVNAASAVAGGSLLDADPDSFDLVVETATRGTLLGTRAAARDFTERGVEGCVVNVVPVGASTPTSDDVAAVTAAGAVRTLTRESARELAGAGVRVNAVVPGPGAACVGDGDELSEIEERVPLGRPGFPEDVVPATLFLASEGASFATGELLAVDGGWGVHGEV